MTTFMSAFSGFGLADIGMMQAGWEHVTGIEYIPAIADVYRANIGPCICGRIQDVNWRKYIGIDAIHASPPCPSFSAAKVGGVETANDMRCALGVCRAIRICQPKYFTLENVRAYVDSRSYKMIVMTLTNCGYGIDAQVVDAANFGVAQNRDRLIMRAVRGGRVPPLLPTHSKGGRGGLKPWVGWMEAIEDLIPTLPETIFADWQIRRIPEAITAIGVNRSLLIENVSTIRDATVVAETDPSFMMTATMCGRRPSNIPTAFLVGQQYDKPAGTEGRAPQCACPNEPAFVVTANQYGERVPKAFVCDGTTNDNGTTVTIRNSDEPIHTIKSSVMKSLPKAWLSQGRVVRLSARCLARFQSMPDWYQLPPSNKLAGTGMGNGVCCLLAQRIAESFENAQVDTGYRMPVQRKLF